MVSRAPDGYPLGERPPGTISGMARLRWGAEAPPDTSAAKVRLIDAAESCFKRFGVMKTTVEDVAAEARVSRATVYRYFQGRDELILGVLMREADRFLDRLSRRIDRSPDLGTSIVDGVLFTVGAVRSDPNLALLFAPEVAGHTITVVGASEALFERTAAYLRPLLEAASQTGQLRPGVDLDDAAEWILRAILSLLTVRAGGDRSEAAQRRFLSTMLVPALASNPPAAERSRPRRRGR